MGHGQSYAALPSSETETLDGPRRHAPSRLRKALHFLGVTICVIVALAVGYSAGAWKGRPSGNAHIGITTRTS